MMTTVEQAKNVDATVNSLPKKVAPIEAAKIEALHDPTSPSFEPFVRVFVDKMLQYLIDERNDENPATTFLHPTQLEEIIKPLRTRATPATQEELMENLHILTKHSAHSGHSRCLNQLFHRGDGMAIIGDWLTSTLNTSIYTYETAPVATLVEKDLIERYREMLGWKHAEGHFPPGGSMSNLYAMCCARMQYFPYVPEHGWNGDENAVAFASIDAHYSVKKTAAMVGLGHANVIGVPVDAYDRIDCKKLVDAIEDAKAKGKKPFFVQATSGTTLTCAYDSIDELADICKKYDMWLHVDGCMGGGVIHSEKYRWVLNGVERADSFCMNPHKMLGVTQQCSLFVTCHEGMMRKAFSTNAAYLFNPDKQYDANKYDVGDALFQCGRRPDCLKLWLTWKYRGDQGMTAYIDKAVENNQTLHKVLKMRSDFRFILGDAKIEEMPGPATCFWWLPGELADRPITDPVLFKAVDTVIPKAKLLLMQEGTSLTFSRLGDHPNFWRIVSIGGVDWTEDKFESFLDRVASACSRTWEKVKSTL